MSDQPTSPWTIFFGFVLIISPVGLVLAFILGPFAVPVLASFFLTGAIAFWLIRAGVNLFTRVFAPEEYDELKRNGDDPFFASLGFKTGGVERSDCDDQED